MKKYLMFLILPLTMKAGVSHVYSDLNDTHGDFPIMPNTEAYVESAVKITT